MSAVKLSIGETMQKRILVVEDDDFFRDTICDVLKDYYEVVQAPNGKSACEILSIQDFDLVISDIQMPGFSGIELLDWSQKNKPVPFVIMTGFSTLLETKSAFDLGAQGFIAKPFKINELLFNLNGILKADDKPQEVKKTIADFCKVSIDEFVQKPKIDFDVYIRLSDTNIIKIAQKNEELPKMQISQYKAKGVRYLYILKEDFNKLIQFNLDLVKVMKDHSSISKDKKIGFLKYTGEVLLEKTFVDGIDKENLQDVSEFIKLSVDSITESEENFDLLSLLSKHSDQVYAHSIGISLYAVLIAKQLGFESSVTHFKLSMAGLFHDVGKKEIDKTILKKPRHLVTKEERKEIESHVTRGYDILSSMKSVPNDVARIVYEHHEDLEGQGYPLKKIKKDQHPLSRIIQCANIFLDYVDASRGDNVPVQAANIINHIEKVYLTRLDADCLNALRKIFKCENTK